MTKISIAQRIKRAMIGLTLMLCLVFTVLAMMMVYVVEDQVFINLLKHEQQRYEQSRLDERLDWQPSMEAMHYYLGEESFPSEILQVVGKKAGVYEYFTDDSAGFLLLGESVDGQQKYVISFDVSEFLAVRSGRFGMWFIIGSVSLFLLLFSIWISSRLAKKTLFPLRQLTEQFQDDSDELPEDFAADFSGDEVGVLAQQLEHTIAQVNAAAAREFEFNRGVSHELRTPIQIAQNSLELLHLKTVQQPASSNQTVLGRLQRSIMQMKQITEAFLWLASDYPSTQQTCDGKKVIDDLIGAYLINHPDRPITAELSKGLNYKAPASVLRIILDNLLRNAMQHSDSGLVKCQMNDQMIRVENAVLKGTIQPGYGIGLSIVGRLCEQLNWELRVDSSSKDIFKAVIDLVDQQ